MAGLLEQINSKLDNADSTIYWTVLPDNSINSNYVPASQDENVNDYIDAING